MMKETDSIYAYKVEHTKDFSFKTMMKLASDFVNDLDGSRATAVLNLPNKHAAKRTK